MKIEKKWQWPYPVFFIFLFFFQSLVYASADSLLLSFTACEKDNEAVLSFKFDNLIDYHCSLLSAPDRLVVDFDHVLLKTQLACNNHFIQEVRNSDHDHQYLRLVFDLKQKLNYAAAFFGEEHELKIILKKTAAIKVKKEGELNNKKPIEPTQSSSTNTQELLTGIKLNKISQPIPMQPPAREKNIIVVIDPGHGGKDPGATGLHGALEKDVVLKISKALQVILNKEPGFSAVLTRNTDHYLSLRKRLLIARKNHADLFVAIHADAYHHNLATGASVYALSQRGATSEAARWLAQKENESELGGLQEELTDKDAMLRSVLIDLSQTHTIESSLEIGNTVLNNFKKIARLHHPRVEQAAFVVLKSPDIPSILVETGFLSNSSEEEKLITAEYQQRTAQAIKEGIKQYFITNSPSGSWFSNNRKSTQEMYVKNEVGSKSPYRSSQNKNSNHAEEK